MSFYFVFSEQTIFEGHLNWWHQFGQKLYPLSTTGDGNCLLHAASLGNFRGMASHYTSFLGMWGVHDRQLSLRETLYELLTNGARKEAIRRRWKWVEHHYNQVSNFRSRLYSICHFKSNGLALTLSESEWQLEWDVVLGLSSPLPRKQEDNGSNSTDQIYESLEQIHVFALAHVLKRPIVVVSDTVSTLKYVTLTERKIFLNRKIISCFRFYATRKAKSCLRFLLAVSTFLWNAHLPSAIGLL